MKIGTVLPLFFFAGLLAGAENAPGACPATVNVGFRVLQLTSTLKAALWYPTTAGEAAYHYSDKATGSVALNGPVNGCDRFPLVLYSHGFGGCGTVSVFITEQLARKGYIVIGPDYKDANCSSSGSSGEFDTTDLQQLKQFADPASFTDQSYIDRRDDSKTAINFMLNNAEFSPFINPDQIGAIGHSLGGYTVFGLIGGWESWRDTRIKAALLLSAYMDAYIYQKSVTAARTPMMYQGGTADLFITPNIMASTIARGPLTGYPGAFVQSNTPKHFLEMGDRAGHGVWTNATCRNSANVAECLATVTNAKLIDDYSIAFFDRYLKQQDPPTLFTGNTALVAFWHTTPASTVSAASYQAGMPVTASSIGALFAEGLAPNSASAQSLPLPTLLGGVTISVQDSAGITRSAPLFFVSPKQVNYLVPEGTANGAARITVRDRSGEVVSQGTVQVDVVSPGLFTADGSGTGLAAGQFQVAGDLTLRYLSDANLAPVSVDVGSGSVYLILYGTGMRARNAATATVGGVSVPVQGPVAQGQFLGLDQLAIGPLPASLAGRGTVEIVVTQEGRRANTVLAVIQ